MPTDDERRDVARRLRDSLTRCSRDDFGDEFEWFTETVCGPIDTLHQMELEDVIARIADLIEPGEPKVRCVSEVKVDGERLKELVHNAAVELTSIDRDALLALADEIEDNDVTYGVSMQYVLGDYACRIREALGVEK